jgi:translation initiation factor IF-2
LAKLRVHQLAKELGLTNAECMELCNELGYGITSHSASLEEAYADNVRRKAQLEGRIRDEQPVEEAPAKKAAAKKAPA